MSDEVKESTAEDSGETTKPARKPRPSRATSSRKPARNKSVSDESAKAPAESNSTPSPASEPAPPREEPEKNGRPEPQDSGRSDDGHSDDRDSSNGDFRDDDSRGGNGGGDNQRGGNGDRWEGGGHGFRRKNKKGKNKGKFFEKQRGPQWKQPPPPAEQIQLGKLPDAERFNDLEFLQFTATEIAGDGEPLFLDDVARWTHAELVGALKEREIQIIDNPARKTMVEDLFKWAAANKRIIIDRGHLDLTDQGFGFVVHVGSNYRLLPDSTYVPASLIRKYGLNRGLEVEVQVSPPEKEERCPSAIVIRSVMGGPPEDVAKVVPFEELIPYYPTQRIFLEAPDSNAPKKMDTSMRCVDILTPVGFGQRGLIVAPPRTGKTIILQGLANSIAHNFPKAKLIVLLVDERPEEVTDFRRRVIGEVVSSTFDESPESHVHAAEMVGEKARRLVERGEDVVILLDSITRLARAYNALASNSGKIMSGGVEATALQKPKRFFGAARNIEGGGSLTVMGTALVDTNSRMDEVIFEEFKGTGNMELHLDRDLVNKRIFPAINFERSGTRKEELLYHPDELQKIYALRRIMLGVPAYEAMEMLIQRLKKTPSNAEFLLALNR